MALSSVSVVVSSLTLLLYKSPYQDLYSYSQEQKQHNDDLNSAFIVSSQNMCQCPVSTSVEHAASLDEVSFNIPLFKTISKIFSSFMQQTTATQAYHDSGVYNALRNMSDGENNATAGAKSDIELAGLSGDETLSPSSSAYEVSHLSGGCGCGKGNCKCGPLCACGTVSASGSSAFGTGVLHRRSAAPTGAGVSIFT